MNEILIVSGIIFIFGFTLLCDSIYCFINIRNSSNWEKTEGSIIESKVVESSIGNSSVGQSVAYKAFIEYTYTINGTQYNSSRVFFGETLLKAKKTESKLLITKFPIGEKVTVYFSPRKPKSSVLINGYFNDNVLIECVFGFLFVFVGIAFYILL